MTEAKEGGTRPTSASIVSAAVRGVKWNECCDTCTSNSLPGSREALAAPSTGQRPPSAPRPDAILSCRRLLAFPICTIRSHGQE